MHGITVYKNESEINVEKFIDEYLPLVKKIAGFIKRKLPSHIEFDDLLQSGLIGLLEARDHFDKDKGASFETFASIRIKGAIIDSLRRNSWVSRDTIKSMKMIGSAINKIEQREQRPATVEEIIHELNISAEEYFAISKEVNLLHVFSLDEKRFNDLPSELDDNPEQIINHESIKLSLKNILKTLPKREQILLSLYYNDELTFKQIGEVLDLTEARICQLHSQAISRIRFKLQSE